MHMLLSGEILTLEGPSSLLRVRFKLIKTDIMSMCGHGTCVNIVVSAFARFFNVFLLFLTMLFFSVFLGLVLGRRKSDKKAGTGFESGLWCTPPPAESNILNI